MTWQPRFNFLSIRPFRDNILSAILANQVDALAWAAVQAGITETLPPLAAVYTARAVRDEHPICNVLFPGGDPRATDGGDYDENKSLLIEVETIATDQEVLFELTELYVLMIKSVLTEMTDEDLTRGIDRTSREEMLLTIKGERYGERPQYDSENTFVQVGSVIATISYREVERET
jgi:hypothetical protein